MPTSSAGPFLRLTATARLPCNGGERL
jgi:hypothetical protein